MHSRTNDAASVAIPGQMNDDDNSLLVAFTPGWETSWTALKTQTCRLLGTTVRHFPVDMS